MLLLLLLIDPLLLLLLLLMLLIWIIGFAAPNCRSGSSVSLLLFRCYCCNQRGLTDADAPAVAAD